MSQKTQYKLDQEKMLKAKYAELRKQLPGFAITWLNSKPNLTWSSLVAYTEDIIRYLKYVINSVEGLSTENTNELLISDISNSEHLKRYDDDFFNAYTSYLAECSDGQYRGSNRNSIERKLVPLRGIYLYYCNRGDIAINPMANYPRYKEPESKDSVIRLSHTEIRALFDALKEADGLNLSEREKSFREKTKLRDYAIIMLLLGTGIRVSELVGADMQHLDFKENSLTVTRKGEHEDQVFFNEEVAEALKDYITFERINIKTKTEEDPLFYSLHGNRISVDAVENVLKKYAGAITNKHISAHLFRKTYGTTLYEVSGGDLALVQDALGHASPTTTKKFYLDTRKRNMKRAKDLSRHITNDADYDQKGKL